MDAGREVNSSMESQRETEPDLGSRHIVELVLKGGCLCHMVVVRHRPEKCRKRGFMH